VVKINFSWSDNFWKSNSESYKELDSVIDKKLDVVLEEKLNPAQPLFDNYRTNSVEPSIKYQQAYERLEVVNRAVNMVVDDTSSIPFRVGDKLNITAGAELSQNLRPATVFSLLNLQPNAFQDVNAFRRNLLIDLIIDGNCFIYWDSANKEVYHLPATKMDIVASEKTYVKEYTFQSKIKFSPKEIIHIKDNSFYSIYRGVSRLRPALRTIQLMLSMRDFQDNFFKNGAVPGLIIKTDNTLSEKIKQRLRESWTTTYNPKSGGRRPMILDGGTDVKAINDVNFKNLDFQNAIAENEKILLKALGVPPILLDSGNNANIRPNMRLYYLETVVPLMHKFTSAYSRFFGYDITENVTNISALQPELNEQSDYYATLVNTGVITPNEARQKLGYTTLEGHDDLRIPANIAGSASNPSEGGRPNEEEVQ